MIEEPVNEAELAIENRQLKNAMNTLLEEIESDGSIDTRRVRDVMPDQSNNQIKPPWERDGFETKQEWLDNK